MPPPPEPQPMPLVTKVCLAVEAKLRSIPYVGVTVEVDARDMAQATRNDRHNQAIMEIVGRADGLADHALEIDFGDLVPVNTELDDSPMPVEEWDLPIVVIAHLPERMPTREVFPATDPATTIEMTPIELAQRFFAAVQELFEPLDDDHGGLGGLAWFTRVMGGGGVAVDNILKTRVTSLLLLPRFRTRTGEPHVAA